jgi:hypothetical protein
MEDSAEKELKSESHEIIGPSPTTKFILASDLGLT